MSEDNTAQFRTEGEPAFPVGNEENDNSSDSQSVNDEGSDEKETGDDQTQSDEGEQNSDDTKDGDANSDDSDNEGEEGDDDKGEESEDEDRGFADHPRWKQREKVWRNKFNQQEERHASQLTELREEMDQRLNDLRPAKEAEGESATQQIPSWFGGDEKQWAEFQSWNNAQREKSQNEVKETLTKESDEGQKKIDEATAYLNEQMSEIETDDELNPSGGKIDRNKLLKFTIDNDLVDSKGRWNYKAAFKMMGAQRKATAKKTLDTKKKVASKTTSEKSAESKAPDFMTSDDFQKPGARPW